MHDTGSRAFPTSVRHRQERRRDAVGQASKHVLDVRVRVACGACVVHSGESAVVVGRGLWWWCGRGFGLLLFSSLHAPPRIHRRSLSQGYVRVRARDTMDRPLAIDRSTDEYIHLSLLLSLPCWINRSIDPDQTIWIATRAVVSVLHCATLLTTPSMTRARPPRRPVVLRPPSSPPLVPPRRFSLSCSLAFVLS